MPFDAECTPLRKKRSAIQFRINFEAASVARNRIAARTGVGPNDGLNFRNNLDAGRRDDTDVFRIPNRNQFRIDAFQAEDRIRRVARNKRKARPDQNAYQRRKRHARF
jgi:hypothetical protein